MARPGPPAGADALQRCISEQLPGLCTASFSFSVNCFRTKLHSRPALPHHQNEMCAPGCDCDALSEDAAVSRLCPRWEVDPLGGSPQHVRPFLLEGKHLRAYRAAVQHTSARWWQMHSRQVGARACEARSVDSLASKPDAAAIAALECQACSCH